MIAEKRFDWRVFLILWLGTAVGFVAVLPYTLQLQSELLAKTTLPMPLWLLLIIQGAQNLVLFGLAAAAGLFLAGRIGLGLPIVRAWLAHEKIGDRIRAIMLPSIVLGVVASLAIIALDVWVFAPLLRGQPGGLTPNVNASSVRPTWWQGFLASFYGAINEEVLTRLFLLSLFAFLGKFISHTQDGRPTLAVLWIANILIAVVFGLGHLPMTSTLTAITPLVVVRAIVLNGLAGLAFGYLYFTRGLESAMLSHFSADLVLHVLFAL